MILVNPAILVLGLLFRLAGSALVPAFAAAPTVSFLLLDTLRVVRLLPSGLRTAFSSAAGCVFIARLSRGALTSAAFAAPSSRLGPLLGFGIAGCGLTLRLLGSGIANSFGLFLHVCSMGFLRLNGNFIYWSV